MSNLVFPPTLPGLKLDVHREILDDVDVQPSLGGKETRFTESTFPRYRYVLNFEVLRSSAAKLEFQKLAGFMVRHRGRLDSFLFTDDEDSVATAEVFSVGNGATTAFQLQRTLVADADLAAPASRKYWPVNGDAYEPVFDLNGAATLQIQGFSILGTVGDGLGTRNLVTTSRTNLALWSEQFDNAGWTKSPDAAITADSIAAPDGNVTADKLKEGTVTAGVEHYADQSVAIANGLAIDCVVYAKAAERSWLYLAFANRLATVAGAYFNVSTGALGTVEAGITATIQNCGNGWYRCAITGNVSSGGTAPRMRVELASADATILYTGVIGNGLHVWGADCEQASTDGDYIPTVGSTVARTDYTLSATALATMGVAPRTGAVLAWTGNYYRRVRFENDNLPMDRIVSQFWSAKSVSLISIKP